MRDDPFFASLFLANLGSVGLSDTFHHLYEYGTVSIFGVVGTVRPTLVPVRGGTVVRELLSVRWTLDERVNDGFYAARSLRIAQDVLEDPEQASSVRRSAAVLPTPEAWERAARAARRGRIGLRAVPRPALLAPRARLRRSAPASALPRPPAAFPPPARETVRPLARRGDARRRAGRTARPPVDRGLRALGAEVYRLRCIPCHGVNGNGKGIHAARLAVPARDFTKGVYEFRSTPSGSCPTDGTSSARLPRHARHGDDPLELAPARTSAGRWWST